MDRAIYRIFCIYSFVLLAAIFESDAGHADHYGIARVVTGEAPQLTLEQFGACVLDVI